MRRCYIVSGIFLILSIIDFALAAPVRNVKRQASVDVVHIPKDSITVLWERGYEEEYTRLMELMEKKIKALTEKFGSPSSVPHASSSAAPPGPDHGSTSVLQSPTPNPGSSTANPYPILESSRPSGPVQGDDEPNWPGNPNKRPLSGPDPDFDWGYWTNLDSDRPPPKRPALSKEPGQAYEYQAERVSGSFGSQSSPSSSWPTESNFDGISDDEVNPKMDHITASPKDFDQAHQPQMGHVQQMNPGPSADPVFNWDYWKNLEEATPLRSAPPKPSNPRPSGPGPWNPGPSADPDFGRNYRTDVVDATPLRSAPPNPSNPGPSADPYFGWNYWTDVVDATPLRSAPPNPSNPSPSGPGPWNPGPSADPDFGWNYWTDVVDATPLRSALPIPSNPGPSNPSLPTEPGHEVVPEPPSTAESTDPELNPDDQAPDRQAAIYAAKGKAKQLRRVSGTARDVANAAQRELQPAERSLDPGE